MADDTATLVAEPEAPAEEAPEELLSETASDVVQGSEPETDDEETGRDFEAELKAAREEAAKEARDAALREAEEQRTQQAYQYQKTQAQQVRQTQGLQQARGLVKWAVDQAMNGRTEAEILQDINPQVTGRLVSQLEAMAMTEQWSNLWEFYRTQFSQDWKPPQALVHHLRQAEATMDPARMLSAAFEYMKAYVRDTEVPKELEGRLKAEREKDKKAANVEKVRDGDKARASAERPVAIGGRGAGGVVINTMDAADSAYNRGDITGQQYADYAKRFGVSLG